VYPDGRSEVLLNVPKYDFNWQLTYLPKKPIFLPKGTRLDCVAHYDNSAKNKFNPDPTQTVRWGDQTWEEMMIGWYTYARADEPQKAPAVSSSSSSR
ncbi:MAG: alkyl hydroperoxide reductase, partial [Blastocatellia bacterium]